MKKTLSVIIRVLLCFVAEFLLFWFKLPPINLKSKDFWGFVIESVVICTVIIAISSITDFLKKNMGKQGRDVLVDGKSVLKNSKKPSKIVIFIILGKFCQ